MAIVKEWTTPRGTKVYFHDDAYVGCSEAELARRRKEIQRTAWWCAAQLARQKAEKQGETTQ